jgi:gliding motility-associated-like protein
VKKGYYILFIILLFSKSLLFAQISVDFSADTTIVCENYPLQFNNLSSSGSNVYMWHWDFGDTAIDSVQNPIHIYTDSGVYTVTLIATAIYPTYTSTDTDSLYIFVRRMPIADFVYTDTMYLPSFLYYFDGTVTNNDNLPYTYAWNFDQTTFQPGDTIQVYTFPKEGTYQVSFLVDAGLGCIDTITKSINVKDEFEAPNIFSPNGDGQNDVFLVKTNGVNECVMDIYNRWGAIVYSLTAKRLQWDGRSSAGVVLPAGTYYYHITSPDASDYDKTGVILLVK